MYLTKEQSENLLRDFDKNLTIELSEKLDFLTKLLVDDDWSFVIKSHSLIESLVTELLIEKIDEPNLKSIIERMPLHGEQVSKISIAKIYNLLPVSNRRFVSKLSEIRNSIVHKYENIDFTFKDYCSKLDKNEKKNWKELLVGTRMDNELKTKIEKVIFDAPKIAVWLTLAYFVSDSLEVINRLKGKKMIKTESDKTAKELLVKFKNIP